MSHVYIAAQRHPLRAAKEFATLDALSGGRVIIGVGAGHVNEEFDLFGPPFEERGAGAGRGHRRLGGRAHRGVSDSSRPRWPASDLSVSPRAVQQPRPPIWVGGSSRAALRRAAQRGDGWLPQTVRRSDMRDQVAQLKELRQDLRAGAPIEIGALGACSTSARPDHELPRGTVSGGSDRIARTWPS